jgi:hypothetical protein
METGQGCCPVARAERSLREVVAEVEEVMEAVVALIAVRVQRGATLGS